MAPRNRINRFHAWALLVIAAFVDTFQMLVTFIPFVGPFLSSAVAIIARIVFWVWLRLLHVGFADKSHRFIANVAITLAEVLPLINALPSWTIGTWVIIKQVRTEDRENNEKTAGI